MPRRFSLALLLLATWLAACDIFSSAIQRGPYLQSVAPDSVWVVWDTSSPVVGQIEYGLTPELGQAVEEQAATRHHELQLTGLQPYTGYYYRLPGHPTSHFRTAASPSQTAFHFAVFGDTRENAFVHRAIVSRIVEQAPDFALHTGDLVESGVNPGVWNDFFKIEAPLLRSTPFYPTLGNHEDYNPPLFDSLYTRVFHLPGNELWYAFDYGNARFICLKADGYSEVPYFPDEEQLAWLEAELSGKHAPWTFVFFHIGMYTSREVGFLEMGMRQRLEPIFERYKVDVVFTGHHHGYERVLQNGITYITTAGGGASFYPYTAPEPGSQFRAHAYHFTLLEVDGNRLLGKAIDRGGKIIDQFELFAGE